MRGIADETIRFNGYPILDQEDHSPDVPGAPIPRWRLVLVDLLCRSFGSHEERPDRPVYIRDACLRCWYVAIPPDPLGWPDFSFSEDILCSTDVKGFPIVASKPSHMLSGYIGRTELRYVLGKICKWWAKGGVSHFHFRQGATYGRCHTRHPMLIQPTSLRPGT